MPLADLAAWTAAIVWLILFLLTWLPSRPWPVRQGSVPPDLRGEPPAVVARLDRRPWADGYAGTLLDLAARGFFRLAPDPADPHRLVAEVTAPPDRADEHPGTSAAGEDASAAGKDASAGKDPGAGTDASASETDDSADVTVPDGNGDGLASYERLALEHVRFRAGTHGSAPASALTGGFRMGDRAFRSRFTAEVRADARRRGLTGRRIGARPAGLLALAAAGFTLAAWHAAGSGHPAHAGGQVLMAGIVMALPGWMMYRAERLTPDGRQALGEWMGFRATMAALPCTAVQASGGDLRIGYAAALGVARGAVSALTEPDDAIWSSYTGTWRQLRMPRAREPFVPGPGSVLAGTALLGAFVVGFGVAAVIRGPLTAMGLAVVPGALLWGIGGWIWLSALRAWRLPEQAEFDGQVLRRWSEVRASDQVVGAVHPRAPVFFVAIDDGRGVAPWALRAARLVYDQCPGGAVVHAVVDVRANRLLSVSPARPGGSTAGPPATTRPPTRQSAGG
jgi:hypothetical protein